MNPHQRYLSFLNATSLQDLEGRIVSQVLTKVRETQAYDERFGAVRLARVVENFDIDPTPEFNQHIPDGCLNYDRDRNRFVISLRGAQTFIRNEAGSLFGLSGSVLEGNYLTRRLRFTYAHEVAHRFCFIRKGDSWTRAVAAVTEKTNRVNRFGVLSRLELAEERLCDRVAGRLLVPEDVLAEYIERRLSRDDLDRAFDLHKELARAAQMFQVSGDCLMVELRRGIARGRIHTPTNLCVLLIRPSDRISRTQHVSNKLRIRTAILPVTIGDESIRPIHPGLGAENLGSEFASWLSDVQGNSRRTHGAITIPLMIRTTAGARANIKLALSGWWKLSRRERLTTGILIWGFLRPEGQFDASVIDPF